MKTADKIKVRDAYYFVYYTLEGVLMGRYILLN